VKKAADKADFLKQGKAFCGVSGCIYPRTGISNLCGAEKLVSQKA